MNREIKFRALTKNNNVMVFGDLIFTPTKEHRIIWFELKGEMPLDVDYQYFDEIVQSSTIGQFTGLKDKNGVDIYEGDLIRSPIKSDWDKENYSCFEVFFHDGDSHLDYNIGYTMCRMHNHGSVCGGHIPSFKPKTVSNMIVIGNIYQHPELNK